MFEKYNMIHVNLMRPITEFVSPDSPAHVQFSLPDRPKSAEFSASDVSLENFAREMSGTRYRLSGSLDFLPPYIQKGASYDETACELCLQSFCLMNNDRNYFTRREHYESLLLSYTYSGEGVLNCSEGDYHIPAGSGFLIDCRQPHEYRTAADRWEHADIHLWGNQAEALYACFRQLGLTLFSFPASRFTELSEELLSSYQDYSRLRDLYIGNALSNLLCSILKKSEKEGRSGVPSVYQYMIHYMESNYMHPLTLDDLSALFHISKYHMSREFRKYTGYSPGEYLIKLRIRHVCILLSESDLTIEQAALESGFENMSNFINQFKRHIGMTPGAFRKSYRAQSHPIL